MIGFGLDARIVGVAVVELIVIVAKLLFAVGAGDDADLTGRRRELRRRGGVFGVGFAGRGVRRVVADVVLVAIAETVAAAAAVLLVRRDRLLDAVFIGPCIVPIDRDKHALGIAAGKAVQPIIHAVGCVALERVTEGLQASPDAFSFSRDTSIASAEYPAEKRPDAYDKEK